MQAFRNLFSTQCLHVNFGYASIRVESDASIMSEEEKDQTKVKGAFARAEALTSEQRSEIAKKAAEARWSKEQDLPQATHEGILQLSGVNIPCAVLKDGTRVITQGGLMEALGRIKRAKGKPHYGGDANLPPFLTAKNLKPFIPSELLLTPTWFEFRTIRGTKANAFLAELLPKICDIFIDAEDDGALYASQKRIAIRAKFLMRALAHVGIIALVDEATGFQYDRARHALTEILEKFISKELVKWVKTFPDEFYFHIFRLRGWEPSKVANQRPVIFGKITNDLVYERMPANTLRHLEELNPKDEKGRRKHKHFQRLTEHIGQPELRTHIASEITIMKGFENGRWDEFYAFLCKVLPKQTPLPLFDDLPPEDETLLFR